MTGLFEEPSRGTPRPTPSAREWTLAMVKERNVRVVNRTDIDESRIDLINHSINREKYTTADLRVAAQELVREGLVERGVPGVTHTSKTYVLQLTKAGRKAFHEQVYRIGITQGPTLTPSAWWLLFTIPAALGWFAMGVLQVVSSIERIENPSYLQPVWNTASVAIAMGLGASLVTWRIFEAHRTRTRRKLLLMLAWIIPVCVVFNYSLLWVFLQVQDSL